MLIDFEYGGWNPRTYDLGNYLNELVCDNAHPEGCGIKHYPENAPSEATIELFVKSYYKEYMADSTGMSDRETEL
jgi:thiamine kinase-like enzyme